MASKKELMREIKNLKRELYKDSKTEQRFLFAGLFGHCTEDVQVPTLKAKVDAIIEHLGIEVIVKEEETKVTPQEIVVKKVKKPRTAKKGKK